MKKTLFSLLCACFVSAGAHAEDLVIPVHRSALIDLPRKMSEVMVADPDVADVYPHGKQKLSIIGKMIGQTTVRVFDEDSGIMRSVDIQVAYDLPAIRKALKDLMPYEAIGVKMVNTNLALTGQVSSTMAAQQAVRIVNEFVAPYNIYPSSGSALKGHINDQQNAAGVMDSHVLNLLEVTSGQQVMLRVRVGEIRRTAMKNLGVNLQAISNSGRTLFQLGTGFGKGFLTSNADGTGTAGQFGSYNVPTDSAFGLLGATYRGSDGDGLSAALSALENNGLFKVLAEPNLVALSGEEAQFLAGGEFPIIVPQNFNSLTVEFKPFGVSVKFKPIVLTENRIRMSVSPEVSEITDQGSITLNGYTIPALNTRRASTMLELSPGESFMIAGLLSDNMSTSINQIPGLGEIPILSALFRSTAYQRQETELVLAVTPYLVDPITSSDIKLPTDNFAPASIMESFFYGALGSMQGNAQRIGQTPQVEGPIGFMVD